VKLRRLDEGNAQRREAAQRYHELLSGLDHVVAPFEPDFSRAVYHLYVIRSAQRDALAEHLKANGVFTGLHYPLPVHLQKCYQHWGYTPGALPTTERVAAEILSLPMFPGVTVAQQERVAEAIESWLAAGL
jgi:dTDP-4-amino-4,6-dideoxygalactose transaminase